MAPTATIRDVELVSVGTWAASTGVTKVTRADLDAMLAAHADGLVDRAPIKLGHVSPLNDDLGDGAPAYGWVTPKRIATNAAGLETLYGDLVGMPAKLAEVAPAAYRRRSVEIAWGVKTPAGKTYPPVLIGVALLGAAAPAVKGLADVLALYSTEPEVERTTTVELVDGLEGNAVAVAMLAAARQAGAPVEQLDAMAAAAGASDTADVPPPVEDPDNDDHHDDPPTTAPAPPNGRNTMTDEELRAALNLEADADVSTALNNLLAERATDPATAGTEPTATETPAEGTGDEGTEGEEEAAETPAEPELVTLSAATYSELTAAAQTIRQDRLTRVLDDAVRAGRIAPAERGRLSHEPGDAPVSGFAAQLERDEEGATYLLSSLSPRFAVTELGDDRAAELSADTAGAFDEFERQTFGLDR